MMCPDRVRGKQKCQQSRSIPPRSLYRRTDAFFSQAFPAGVVQADGGKKKMRVNISLELLIIPAAYPAPLLPSMHSLGSIWVSISLPCEHLSAALLEE